MEKSVSQQVALGIHIHLAAQKHNALHQTPDAADYSQRTAGQHTYQQLRQRLSGKAQVEVVNTQRTKEDPQQTRCELALGAGADNGRGGGAAVGAYDSPHYHRAAAVVAICVACAPGDAASDTDNRVRIHGTAAILTMHFLFLPKTTYHRIDNTTQPESPKECGAASRIP